MAEFGLSELNVMNPSETIRAQIVQEAEKKRPAADAKKDMIFSALSAFMAPVAYSTIGTKKKQKPQKYADFDVAALTPAMIERANMTKWTDLIDKLKMERDKDMKAFEEMDLLRRFEQNWGSKYPRQGRGRPFLSNDSSQRHDFVKENKILQPKAQKIREI